MTRFTKPALTLAEQIARLRAGGMTVTDDARAEHWLRHVSYYRLSGYWHIWKAAADDGAIRFGPGADFRPCLYGISGKNSQRVKVA